jgi:hypothetical protein
MINSLCICPHRWREICGITDKPGIWVGSRSRGRCWSLRPMDSSPLQDRLPAAQPALRLRIRPSRRRVEHSRFPGWIGGVAAARSDPPRRAEVASRAVAIPERLAARCSAWQVRSRSRSSSPLRSSPSRRRPSACGRVRAGGAGHLGDRDVWLLQSCTSRRRRSRAPRRLPAPPQRRRKAELRDG